MTDPPRMTFDDVMAELRALGTAQNVRVYRRHGMGENVFGVPFAGLSRLHKRIKVDHHLALQLWASGNADARHLALQIADPAAAGRELLQEWAGSLSYYQLADMLAAFTARTPLAREMGQEWIDHGGEWVSRAGWGIWGFLALRSPEVPDADLERLLERIEGSIHGAPNFTRHAMNNTLICIGMRNAALKALAQAAARRIGRVVVDHGETSCRTPDAFDYIERAYAHQQRRRAAAS